MSGNSVAYWIKSINRQVALELLVETLDKAEALSEISVVSEDFLNQNPMIIHNFLWTLNTLVIQAKRHCNQVVHGK